MNVEKIPNTKEQINGFLNKFNHRFITLFYNKAVDCDMAVHILRELLDNAFEHGNKKDESKKIKIISEINANILTVSVEDEGEGFTTKIPNKLPPLNIPRGRGLWSIKQIVSSIKFNYKRNKVTVTFLKKEGNMSNEDKTFQVFEGRVIIIKSGDDADINNLAENIVKMTTDVKVQSDGSDLYLCVDLSRYAAVSSSFFGSLGATIQLPYVKQVALTGMRSSVAKIAKRFGIVDGAITKVPMTREITDNAHKFRIFDSLEKAVLELIPENRE